MHGRSQGGVPEPHPTLETLSIYGTPNATFFSIEFMKSIIDLDFMELILDVRNRFCALQ